MKREKVIALLMALVLCFALLAGCGSEKAPAAAGTQAPAAAATEAPAAAGQEPAAAEADKTVVNVAVSADPGSLSPWVGNNGGRINILGQIYQHLAESDGFGGPIVGVLMESYEAVDERTYDMKLYEGIYDTAGNPVKASDVVFSYQTDIDMGFHAGRLAAIESLEAVDEYTVRWTFVDVPYDGDLLSVWSESYIVSQAAYEASPDEMATDPVGTSPYKMTDYVSGTSVTVERTGDYWQKDASKTINLYGENVDVINFKVITDVAQIANGLKTGEVDMTNTLDPLDLAAFQDGGEYADQFNVITTPANPAYMLAFNCDEASVCNNVNMRMALAYGINVDEIVASVLSGHGFRFNALGNPKYGDYNDEWGKDGYFEFNLDTAKSYLEKFTEETGIAPADVTIKMVIKDGIYTYSQKMCEVLQGYIMQLGMNATIESQGQTTFDDYVGDPATWDMNLLYSNSASTNYLIVWYQNVMLPDYYAWGGSQNFIKDETLWDLVNAARTIEGHNQENMDKLNDYINENCYYYGLCGFYDSFVAADWITELAYENRNCILPGGCSYDFSAK